MFTAASLTLQVLLLTSSISNPDKSFPNFMGTTGILNSTSAIPREETSFGVQAIGSVLTDEPFIDARKHTRSALRIGGNYQFPWNLEAFLGTSFYFNEHSDANASNSATSFFENTDLGAKWSTDLIKDRLYIGGMTNLRFFSGTRMIRNTSGFSDQSSGPVVSGSLVFLTSLTMKDRWENFPLKAHFNLGYRAPNGDLVPPANTASNNRTQDIELFNYDAYKYHAMTMALGFETPYRYVTPFAEYKMEYNINKAQEPVKASDNRQVVALGARVTPMDAVSLLAALHLGLQGNTAGRGVGIPQNPSWEAFFGVAFAATGKDLLDTTGGVRGRVIDSETNLPLPDVTATIVGDVKLPQTSDGSGFYEIANLDDGSYRVKFDKDGYDSQVKNFDVRGGRASIVDVALSTLGPKKGKIVARFVDSQTNEAIEKAYVEISGVDRPLATDESGEIVADRIPEGARNIRIQAPGYVTRDIPIEIFANETLSQTFTLDREAPTTGTCTGTVVNEEGTGLTAVFVKSDGAINPFGTDPLSGSFSQSLPVGTHLFKVQAENYLPQDVECVVTSGEISTLEIVLKKPEKATVVDDKIILPEAIFFGFDSNDIRDRSFKVLDQVADILIKAVGTYDSLKIEGHTDSQGTEAYNQGLSERRASSVRQYLIDKGLDASRVEAIGFGETKPIATNLTDEGRAENRRVEFNLIRGTIDAPAE